MAYPIVNILNVPVAALTMSEAVSKVQQFIDDKKNALIATANAEMIMNAQHDEELCEILQSADLVVPDGAGAEQFYDADHLRRILLHRKRMVL